MKLTESDWCQIIERAGTPQHAASLKEFFAAVSGLSDDFLRMLAKKDWVYIENVAANKRPSFALQIGDEQNLTGKKSNMLSLAIEVGAYSAAWRFIRLGLPPDIPDSLGSTALDRAKVCNDKSLQEWAKSYGTYMGKYRLLPGPPEHSSATCNVIYAIDVSNQSEVAIKIMHNEQQYITEVETRKRFQKGNCFIVAIEHNQEVISGPERNFSLAMKRAERSLFDIINKERWAGRDVEKVQKH